MKKPSVNPRAIYTLDETAVLLHKDRRTIYRYRQKGHLPFRIRKSDNRIVICGEDIIRCFLDTY